MNEQLSFIEKQFPVSKVSKESYKERKANNGQTLTGLGKWWGRKPLILVRAAILGCLIPDTGDAKSDMKMFQKLLLIDNDGLLIRKKKSISIKNLYDYTANSNRLKKHLSIWFEDEKKMRSGVDKKKIETEVFCDLGYDEKLKYCVRPEEIDDIPEVYWQELNAYYGVKARSLDEFVKQISRKRYGRTISVGDCFSGGGSIPFEASRMGFDVYGSDLNPIAALLSWADINICGMTEDKKQEVKNTLDKIYKAVDDEIINLGIENSSRGERAIAYLYCSEIVCPECGGRVPLAPSWVIGKRTKTVAEIVCHNKEYKFNIKMNVSDDELKAANKGTVSDRGVLCPHCRRITPISTIRHDGIDNNGNISYGLRKWDQTDYEPKEDDVFQEKLYAIKYMRNDGTWYYATPDEKDYKNESKVSKILEENFAKWQSSGYIPTMEIADGYNTEQLLRERGWRYWHQLFNSRQLLTNALLIKNIEKYASNKEEYVLGLLGLNRVLNWNSELCSWSSYQTQECGLQTFYNQALNTFYNYSTRAFRALESTWYFNIANITKSGNDVIELKDARDVSNKCDYWITDPPYADAVNYHELSEFFIAWDKMLMQSAFPDWYVDSKKVLAVRGDDDFSGTMIDIYSNLANNMPIDGMQIVMFTHSNPAVWAQLAVIMWKSSLRVSAAWNIATETDVGGIRSGNYVKGTVLLVLRKQTGDDIAFLDEINADIRNEVKSQIESMQKLDDKEEPNFADPDYVLAAYAASLKVLTSYASIEDLDLDYELNQAISNPTKSKVVTIIENAKKIAYDCVIPLEFDNFLWRELTNAEKFYIKGLESEKRGDYQIGTYQEFARGFSIGGYGQMMASEKANTARLKTPVEMAGRTIREVPDFERSVMRTVFQGIYVGIKEDNNPNKALGFIKSDMDNYWDKREMIQQILKFLLDIKYISNMQDHWEESAEMAELLLTLVAHDSI